VIAETRRTGKGEVKRSSDVSGKLELRSGWAEPEGGNPIIDLIGRIGR
jgi:hypothetical protein